MADETLTRQRDLRDAEPLWARSPHISIRTRRTFPARHFDIVIVGAGISGALMADALADGKCSVLVIDRREPGHGSTMASTAMIQHEIDVPLHELRNRIGKKNADRAWQRSAKAVDSLAEGVEKAGVVCSFRRKHTLYLAGDSYGRRALAEEAEVRADAGLAAEYISQATLKTRYGLDRTAALLTDISASANPAQITAGFLRQAAKRGAIIVEGPAISDIRETGNTVALATSEGAILTASHTIFCTGYEFLKPLASQDHEVMSTWAIASRPGLHLPQWLRHHLVWEGSDPYLYFRATRDGRIIAGGEDEKSETAFDDDRKRRAKALTIVSKLKTLTGIDIGEPEAAWSAAFGSTSDGLPLIGIVPGMQRTYAVMGFGGNGITFSKIAAEIVAGDIMGRRDPDADLFRFDRG